MNNNDRPPLISVLIPTRQSRRFLDARIESILAQGISDIEVLNVDTQSTDGTVEALSLAFGTRLRTFQQPPGLYGAWNRAIREARGEFLHFATSDDFEDPTFYQRCLDVLRSQAAADAVSTQWTAVDASGRHTLLQGWGQPPYRSYIGYRPGSIRRADPRTALFFTLFFGYPAGVCNGTVFRRRAFEKAGLFPETYGPCGDWGWWLAAAAKCELWMVDSPLAHWRVCDGQATSSYARFNRYRNELRILRDTLQVLEWQQNLTFLDDADRQFVCGFIKDADAALSRNGIAFYLRLLAVQPDKVLHAFTKKLMPYYAPFWISRIRYRHKLRAVEAPEQEAA